MSTRDHATTARHEAAGTRSVARGGIANLVGAGYSGLASFAIVAIVARISTTEDAGIYFAAVALLLMVVALAELGVPVGYVYFFARARRLEETAKLRTILMSGAVPIVVLGMLLVSVGLVFREQLAALLLGAGVAGGPTIMVILAATIPVAVAADSALGATRGLGTMRPTVLVDKFVNPTVQLLALVLLALVGWTGGQDLVWTRVVGFVAVCALALPWLARLLRRFPRKSGQSFRTTWLPQTHAVGEFWRFTGPRAVGQIAQVGIQRIDIILVALWLGPSVAAVYAAATRFLIFGQLAANAIGTAVQPRISALAARHEMIPVQDLYRTSTAWIMLATWPLYLTFIVQAEWLMQLFGEQYAAGAVVLRLLSTAMLVATACGAVDAVLLMAGRSTWTMVNAWAALVINVGLNVWLIPRIGILGATLAWVAAILASNLIPLVQVRVGLRVHPFGWISLLAALVPAVLFGAVPWVVSQLGAGWPGAIASTATASAIYALVLWRWRRPLGLVGLFRRSGMPRTAT